MNAFFVTLSHDGLAHINAALQERVVNINRPKNSWGDQLWQAYFSAVDTVRAKVRKQAPWGLLSGPEENRLCKVELELIWCRV